MKKISEHPLPIIVGVVASIVGLLYTMFVFFSGRSSIITTEKNDVGASPKNGSISKGDSVRENPEKKFNLTTLNANATLFDNNYCNALLKISKSSKDKFLGIVDFYAMKPNVIYDTNATIFKSDFFKISSWLSKSGTPVINLFSNPYDSIHIRDNLERIKACLGTKPVFDRNALTVFRFVDNGGVQSDLDCCMCIWTYWNGTATDKSNIQILIMTWNDYKKHLYYIPSRLN